MSQNTFMFQIVKKAVYALAQATFVT